MNNYRNAHYQTLAKSKVNYSNLVKEIVQDKIVGPLSDVELTYIYYPKDKRRRDIGNVCSIVDKYFADALVEMGIIEDDDYTIYPKTHYYFGSIDRINPRVDVIIRTTGNDNMLLIVDKETITGLVKQHINEVITVNEGVEVSLEALEDGSFEVRLGEPKTPKKPKGSVKLATESKHVEEDTVPTKKEAPAKKEEAPSLNTNPLFANKTEDEEVEEKPAKGGFSFANAKTPSNAS